MKHPKDVRIHGIKYSLKHIWPKNIIITLPAIDNHPELEIPTLIFFSNHCISKGAKKEEPYDMADHNGYPRIFCQRRYNLSFGLLKILKNIPNKKCLFVPGENYLHKDFRIKNGEYSPYCIYFSIARHRTEKNGLVMWINSAHIKNSPNQIQTRKGMADGSKFVTLARKILA